MYHIPIDKPLYVIKKAFSLFLGCWQDSKKLSENGIKSRMAGFCDLLYSLVRYGADYSNYLCFEFYRKNGAERNKFVTYWRNEKLWRIYSKESHHLFLNKTNFNHCFKDYILRDWIDTEGLNSDDIHAFISKYDTVIVKPLESAMGLGVYKLDCHNDVQIMELLNNIKEGMRYIIEETLENVFEIKRLNPPSLNTIRMVTVIDGKGNLHLVAARMRMGATNACTDNVCTGGIVCAIDEKTGKICTTAKNHAGQEFSKHPNTGVDLIGHQIPMWNDCLMLTEKLAHVVPSARYVGWDLAITTKGIDVLEGNIPPDEGVTQMNHEKGMWNEFLCWI